MGGGVLGGSALVTLKKGLAVQRGGHETGEGPDPELREIGRQKGVGEEKRRERESRQRVKRSSWRRHDIDGISNLKPGLKED